MYDLGGDRNVVEEAEAHVLVRFGVVAWRTNDGKGFLHFPSGDGQSGFNDATRTQLSGIWCSRMNVEGQVIIVCLRVRYVLVSQRYRKRLSQ